ncbi:MAG: hypothetical protein QG604_980 [Candidatus Dependentiae bacterium]|nr:hypothetical protein [Candidatus Dependentiae bacterium]
MKRLYVLAVVLVAGFHGSVGARTHDIRHILMMLGGVVATAGGGYVFNQEQKKEEAAEALMQGGTNISGYTDAMKKSQSARLKKRIAAVAAILGLVIAAKGGHGAWQSQPKYVYAGDLEKVPGWVRMDDDVEDVIIGSDSVQHKAVEGTPGHLVARGLKQAEVVDAIKPQTGLNAVCLQDSRGLTDLSALADGHKDTVEALWLSRSGLSEIPAGTGDLIKLKKLCLDTNKLRSLRALARLTALEEKLCVRDNNIQALPELADMPALREVDAGKNPITQFEESWIADRGSLVKIHVNEETRLPVSWCKRELLAAESRSPLVVRAGGMIYVYNPDAMPIQVVRRRPPVKVAPPAIRPRRRPVGEDDPFTLCGPCGPIAVEC